MLPAQVLDRDVPNTHRRASMVWSILLESPDGSTLSGTAHRSLENLSSRPHIPSETARGYVPAFSCSRTYSIAELMEMREPFAMTLATTDEAAESSISSCLIISLISYL